MSLFHRHAVQPSPAAIEANRQADEELERARQLRVASHEAALDLSATLGRNHFAQSFMDAMERQKPE